MIVPCTRIAVGDFAYNVRNTAKYEWRKTQLMESASFYRYSNVVNLTETNMKILVEHVTHTECPCGDGPQGSAGIQVVREEVRITSRDVVRVDANLWSSTPFLSFLLTRESTGRDALESKRWASLECTENVLLSCNSLWKLII